MPAPWPALSYARIPLTPNRPVADVTEDLLSGVERLAGAVEINATPQEVTWTVPLDEDREHATWEAEQVVNYFEAATQAALALAEFRAPFRGRSTPVNAWWGTFDLAVNFFSGRPAGPPSDDYIMRNGADAQQVSIGWWPGDARHDGAAFFAFAYPMPDGFGAAELGPDTGRWDPDLGEYVLEWDQIRERPERRELTREFMRSAFQHACAVCEWDPALAATAEGVPPPIR